MVNIWEYNIRGRVKIITKHKTDFGSVFLGSVVCVENTEENEREEDDITIETDDGLFIGFLESEIESIEILERW